MNRESSILHVMWRMRIGGAERAVYQLVREQQRRGMIADVAVASEPGFYADRLTNSGATVHLLRCRRAWDIGRSLRLTEIAGRYPIIHVHGIEPLLIVAVSRTDSALVYTHRGGFRSHGWSKRCRLAAAKPYVRRFNAISGNTRHSARVAARWLGLPIEDVHVVHNGLDFALLKPAREREDVLTELPAATRSSSLLVGTASNLQELKRVDLLVSALAKTDSDIHCVVLGDGPARSHLEQLTLALGVTDRIHFLGRREHIGDYLQLFDAFVLPSGPEEAFGNAAVEAMGVGVPTIVFADGGGLTEHVTDRETGLVVRNVDELAASLVDLKNDSLFRKALGSAGRTFVRHTYSLDAMYERYAALYRSVARGAA
jgi:glycosyltransferase involved in cell wall biosynthesis